jgi:hypothetical protein
LGLAGTGKPTSIGEHKETDMTIGAGVFLLAIGAIFAFAVKGSVGWLDLNVVGWVLMVAGALGLVLGFVQIQRRRVVTTSGAGTPGPRYVEESETYPPTTTEVVETDAPPARVRRQY